jgi:large repetitive protein
MRRLALLTLALLALAALVAGGSGSWAAFSSTTSNGPGSFSSAPDWTAPTVSASVIAHSASGAGVKSSGTYAIYANVSDTGNPASGVSTVTANVNSITTGQTAVALSACSSSCTVGGVTYGYKSATLTANSGLTGGASINYTLTPKDAANNTGSAQTFSVTVDNTAPTSLASVAAHATAAARVKASGTYYVYANASDASSGVDTITANVNVLTAGQTAVPLTACSSSCTVAGTTYAYKSAQLTADSTVTAGSKTFTITATDAAGNATAATSFAATVDNTAPTASAVATANGTGGTTGKPELNDTVTLTFSEQMDPASILSGWSGSSTPIVVRISNAGGAAHDFVTFWDSTNTTQLTTLGNVDLGRAGYVNTGATITFGASGAASTMVQSGAAVTITLGTPSTTANRVTNTTTMIWNSSSSPTDLAGNAATGNARTEGGTADAEF